MNRRGFLAGVAGFLAAPAIVRASSLMPVSVQPIMVDLPKPIYSLHVGEWRGVALIVTEDDWDRINDEIEVESVFDEFFFAS